MTREEAIKILKEYAPRIKPFYEPQCTEYPQAIDMAIEALQAETKHGKWVLGDGYYCSSCGYNLQTTAISCFCPNCGAKMYKGGDTE